MVFPKKHIKVKESLIGIGGIVLEIIDEPCAVDKIWEDYTSYIKEKNFGHPQSFDNLVLAIDVLFAFDLIKLNQDSLIERCDY